MKITDKNMKKMQTGKFRKVMVVFP